MSSFIRAVRLMCLCVALVFLMDDVAAVPRPRAVRPFSTKYHSLSQACYGVLEDVCPPASANRAECLMHNFERNKNHECKLWVGWRTICLTYVEMKLVKNGVCNFTEEESTPALVRECLSKVDKRKLPEACFNNPYYKSLHLHGRRQMDDDDADL